MNTVKQSKELRASSPHGGYTKNLFLRAKKGSMWLVTCSEDRVLDLRSLAVGLRAGHLSFGSPERLMKYLGVLPGAVSPLALINDTGRAVSFVIEEQLFKRRIIHLHPLDNRRTTTIETQGLLQFTQNTGHSPLGLAFHGPEVVITGKVVVASELNAAEI
jgi:Ala-tRNA(Pro) deacylase